MRASPLVFYVETVSEVGGVVSEGMQSASQNRSHCRGGQRDDEMQAFHGRKPVM